jgi:hypothetical protein
MGAGDCLVFRDLAQKHIQYPRQPNSSRLQALPGDGRVLLQVFGIRIDELLFAPLERDSCLLVLAG